MISDASGDTYKSRQDAMNRQCRKAWDEAPKSFQRQAAARGLKMDMDGRESEALPFNETASDNSYIPDMAEALDTHVDLVIEKHGCQYALLIRSVAEDLKIPMLREVERNRALLLNRVIGHLLQGGRKNFMARVHGLLHALPTLAESHGYSSLSKSAEACGVSRQWMMKSRDFWCGHLDLPNSALNRKTPEAIAKYRLAALDPAKHWRKRSFKFTPTPTCTPQTPRNHLKPIQPRIAA